MSLIVETSDFKRFPSAPQYAAFLSLVPGEHSSSDSCNRLPITKAGNSHLRRLLIEAANSYGRARVGRKYVRISTRSKGNIAKTAVAWELACFVWSMMNGKLS